MIKHNRKKNGLVSFPHQRQADRAKDRVREEIELMESEAGGAAGAGCREGRGGSEAVQTDSAVSIQEVTRSV
jgi:hypothetical protein